MKPIMKKKASPTASADMMETNTRRKRKLLGSLFRGSSKSPSPQRQQEAAAKNHTKRRGLRRRTKKGVNDDDERDESPRTDSQDSGESSSSAAAGNNPVVEVGSLTQALKHTRVMAVSTTVPAQAATSPNSTALADDNEDGDHVSLDGTAMSQHSPASQQSKKSGACCASTEATAILQHSYLDLLCGDGFEDDEVEEQLYNRKRLLPDDPTVQESIECIFERQLQEGLPHMLLDDDEEERGDAMPFHKDLVAPSRLQQSLLKSRVESKVDPFHHHHHHHPPAAPAPRKRRVHSSLVHVGTHDPAAVTARLESEDELQKFGTSTDAVTAPVEDDAAAMVQRFDSMHGQCECCQQTAPLLAPDRWPQRPLLLRPTPGSGTRVKGIRFCSSSDYMWQASRSTTTWPASLQDHWRKHAAATSPGDAAAATTTEAPTSINPLDVLCPECMVLPVNNGNEPPGETLVTDFESEYFEGTLLVRLRNAHGTTRHPYDDSKGYFCGMNRRYQVVIRGRFKCKLPLTGCLTGFELNRAAGKLPPKWMVKSTLKVISFFAPQLQARLDGPRPYSLTPLGSTPQCLAVHDSNSIKLQSLEQNHQEPAVDEETLLQKASPAPSSLQRARFRKKNFDRLFAQQSIQPKTDPSKVYTFEFLQHLVNFQDFEIELGSMLGSIALPPVLNGQPLQIMASCPAAGNSGTAHSTDSNGSNDLQQQDPRIWSFDVWHESLYADAKCYDDEQGNSQL